MLMPTDHGPMYRETDLGKFIVEPYNTASAVLFALLAVYWIWKLRKEKLPLAIHSCLYLLLIGGIGGTLYHGTRAHVAFLIMDFLPILLIAIVISFHLWRTLSKNGTIIFVGSFATLLVFRFVVFSYLPRNIAINGGYTLIALMIAAPIFLFAKVTQWKDFYKVVAGVIFFAVALFFRIVDNTQWMPLSMGSHWLWHLFSFISVAILLNYLFRSPRNLSSSRGTIIDGKPEDRMTVG